MQEISSTLHYSNVVATPNKTKKASTDITMFIPNGRVKVGRTVMTPSIGIDYWLYTMSCPVQYIISLLLIKITV